MAKDCGESHLNTCKRALYVALISKPVNAYTKSDVNLMSVLAEDPYIQTVLDKARSTENATKI
jgi:hypothetical protein